MQLDRSFWKSFITRRYLSNVAWDVFSQNVVANYSGRAKNSLLANKGFVVSPLDPALAERLTQSFDQCPKSVFGNHDLKPGYFYEPRENVHDYFNLTNNYFSADETMKTLLQQFLIDHAQKIEDECQHPWRVASYRLFSLNHGFNTGALHLDGWPMAIKKIFVLPQGASQKIGTTFIKTKDGQDVHVESTAGIWLMFENSLVEHQAVLPKDLQANPRRTIEIDIVPAINTDPRLVDGGVNGWYPWFPETNLSTPNSAFQSRLFEERMNKRIENLAAALEVANYGVGVDDYLGPNDTTYASNPPPTPTPRRKRSIRRWLKNRISSLEI